MSAQLPRFADFLFPTMQAIQELGGSGSNSEITAAVIKVAGFTDEQQNILHKNGPQSQIEYFVGWAKTYLKKFGYIDNSTRGVWSLTDEGLEFLGSPSLSDANRVQILYERQEAKNRFERTQREAKGAASYAAATPYNTQPEQFEDSASAEPDTWKETLLALLTSPSFTPKQFERLTQRLLREASFESVTVTGRSGDQGIDGIGIYRLGLLTFPVFFQCKRYKGSVGPGEVRDFRGAMQGRGEKGLLITTGSFTKSARDEASRDGTIPIELIDGDKLCDLLQEYSLGIGTQVVVDAAFFSEI